MSTINQASGDSPRTYRVGIVTSVLTPYWLHVFLRFAREILGVVIVTCSLFEQGDQPWDVEEAREIQFTCMGPGDGTGERRGVLSEWKKADRVIQWILTNKLDAVVVGGYNDLCRLRVIHWCYSNQVPVLLSADSNVRSPRPDGLVGFAKERLLAYLRPRLSALLVCGRHGADYFFSYGFPPEKTFVCPVEPDYRLIQELPQSAVAAVQRKHRLDPERRRVLACSRMIPRKRMDMSIHAFTQIAAHRPEWDLVLVGDGPIRAELEALVPQHLRHRVIFTGFVGDQREVAALYRACNVLVHAAEFEPFGLVIPEAAAAGLAVVCSSVVGASPELVNEGVNGRYFPVGNLRVMTEALLDSTDPKRFATYQANSLVLLEDWRRRGNPVRGLVQALNACGCHVTTRQPPAYGDAIPVVLDTAQRA